MYQHDKKPPVVFVALFLVWSFYVSPASSNTSYRPASYTTQSAKTSLRFKIRAQPLS